MALVCPGGPVVQGDLAFRETRMGLLGQEVPGLCFHIYQQQNQICQPRREKMELDDVSSAQKLCFSVSVCLRQMSFIEACFLLLGQCEKKDRQAIEGNLT